MSESHPTEDDDVARAREAELGVKLDGPPTAEVVTATVPATAPKGTDASRTPPYTHTRASGFWAAVVVGLVVLLVLVIFILENGQRASVSFFGTHGHLPEGVALLLAAVIGGLFVVFAGAARILQLRTRAHVQLKKVRGPAPRRRGKAPSATPTSNGGVPPAS